MQNQNHVLKFNFFQDDFTSFLGDSLSNQKAGDLSTLFDIGGIFGGILAGLLSDLTGMSAVTCAGAYILTVPMVIESE